MGIEKTLSETPDLIRDAELVEHGPEKFPLKQIHKITVPKKLPNGDTLLTECTVLIGEDGKAKFIQLPPEFLLPDAECPANGTLINFVNAVGKQRGAVGMAAMSLVAACDSSPDDTNIRNDQGFLRFIAHNAQALTAEAAASFGNPQEMPWTQDDEWGLNISEFNGRKVITFPRTSEINQGIARGIWYVDCEELEECIDGIPQEIPGLPQEGIGHYVSAAIYTTPEGQPKIILKAQGEQVFNMDVAQNVDGVLEASGAPTPLNPPASPAVGFSFMEIDNIPYLLTEGRLQDLHTGEIREIPEMANEDLSVCGGPHFDGQEGSVWMGSKFDVRNQNCELVTAPTLQGLADQITYLNGIANSLRASDVMSPRVSENFLIFVARRRDGTKIYYALVQPHCGDGEQAPWETPENCPEDFPVLPPDAAADAAQLPPDAAPPDAAAPDAAVDAAAPDQGPPVPDQGPPPVDQGQPPVDQGAPPTDTLPGDAALPTDGVPPADATPPVDTLPPADALLLPVDGPPQPPDAASDATPNPDCETLRSPGETEEYSAVHLDTDFIVRTNDCTLQICDLKVGDIEGHRITGDGPEICSGKIKVNGDEGKKIDFTFTHDEGGTVRIDCKLLPGQEMLCERFPNVDNYRDETNLHLNMTSKFGQRGVNTGADGSTLSDLYLGMVNGYHLLSVTSFQPEGAEPVLVYYSDNRENPILIITPTAANRGVPFMVRFDADGNYEEEPFPQFPDTGTTEPRDATTEPPKTDAGVDADVQPPAAEPKKAASCKCDFGLGETPIGGAALLAFMGLLAMIFRRRERAKQ